ncbi:MAG: hypothetical protein JO053_07905 [Acidobacteria bacterium]|nr:hypothetical protein [Acidobacteriota bacterium]
MNPRDKARLLGLFFWLFTLLNVVLVVGIGIIYTAVVGVAVTAAPPNHGEAPPAALIVTIVAVAFFFVLIVTVLFSIPKIVAGIGLRKEKPWARTWAIIASIMSCMSFPIGTAIGVFGLIFLLSDEGKAYFASQQYGQLAGAAPMTPPPANSWQ